MTLFGPQPAATAAPLPLPDRHAWPEPGRAHDRPAFERRAMLRQERHRLVSEVRRREGISHREINMWLNRKLGIASVERASLEELERSVDLLVGKLTGKR
jgi:hypothetical protein